MSARPIITFRSSALRCLWFVLLLSAASSAAARNFYVNSRFGNDNNDGRSVHTPWQGFKNLENNVFLPGDSILFANGSSYTGGFIFLSSGSADKPIVFSHYSLSPDSIRTINRSKLEPLFAREGGRSAPSFSNPDWSVLYGNVFNIKGNYVVIEGLYFHDNLYPPESDHVNKNVQKMGAVYLAFGTHHNTVRNCEFFHSPVGIKVKGTHNIIEYNYLHDATDKLAYSWGPIAIMITQPYNEVRYNRIMNYGSLGGPYGADGGVIELDGIDDNFTGRCINIHHNISIGNYGFLELAGRGMDSITLAYNLSDDMNQFVGGGSMNHVFVFNNTIIRTKEPNVDRYVFWSFNPDSTFLELRNNIFVVPADIQVYGPFVRPLKHARTRIGNQPHDHNLYFTPGNRNADPLGGIPKGKGDIIADPLFIDAANGNYRLKENSPARNSGTRLPGYTTDLDGYRLPATRNPNIGAY